MILVFSVDNNYVGWIEKALKTIVDTNDSFCIYVLHTDLTEENQNLLREITELNFVQCESVATAKTVSWVS